MKISNQLKGKIGEFIALMYLRMKFYRLIKKNLKMKTGEIDILMKHKKTLIAVEVKLRHKPDNIKYAITKKQYTRIANSLLKVSESHPEFTDIRIDAIYITLKPFTIEQITLEKDSLH